MNITEGKMTLASFLAGERTIAAPAYSRWLIPPAALCVHLCIGQAYAFIVFNLPLTKLIGISQSDPDVDWKLHPAGLGRRPDPGQRHQGFH